MGKLLSIEIGPERARGESTRATYYGIFFRDRNGKLQVSTGNFYAERERAEKLIAQYRACVTDGMRTDYFIGALSVPVLAEEQAKCVSL